MKRAGRLGVVLASLAAAACGSGASGGAASGLPASGACMPVDGALQEGATLDGKGGTYRLTMVAEAGSPSAEGELLLEVRPADRRAFRSMITPLAGTVDIDLLSVGAQPVRGLDSTDPAAPGVLVLERGDQSGAQVLLRFGSESNRTDRQPVDAAYTVLEARRISSDAFFGIWRSGVGTERSEGHFCAWRDDG